MTPVATIIVQSTVQVGLGYIFSSIFSSPQASPELSVENLEKFLGLLSHEFSNIVEEIMRVSLVDQDIRQLKAKLIEATDAFKDYCGDPSNKSDLQDAKRATRELYSKVHALKDGIAQIKIAAMPSKIYETSPRQALQEDSGYQSRILFLNLIRGICALELLLLGTISGTAVEEKIKQRSIEYHNIMMGLVNEIFYYSYIWDISTNKEHDLRNNCKNLIEYKTLNDLFKGLHEIVKDNSKLSKLESDAELHKKIEKSFKAVDFSGIFDGLGSLSLTPDISFGI